MAVLLYSAAEIGGVPIDMQNFVSDMTAPELLMQSSDINAIPLPEVWQELTADVNDPICSYFAKKVGENAAEVFMLPNGRHYSSKLLPRTYYLPEEGIYLPVIVPNTTAVGLFLHSLVTIEAGEI